MEQTPLSIDDHVTQLNLYVELKTSRLYEGKLFEDFVLLRPILPQFHDHIKKVPLPEFGKDFEDYEGDRSSMKMFLKRFISMPTQETVQ